jgi:putative transposase
VRSGNGALRFHRSSPTSTAFCSAAALVDQGALVFPRLASWVWRGSSRSALAADIGAEQPPIAEVEEPGFPEEQHSDAGAPRVRIVELQYRIQFWTLIRSPKTGPFKARVFRDIFPWLEERKTMKASQFSDAQKAFILKQGNDGVPVADICRKAGISQATYFNWKKKYDGMQPPEMRRLKQLEDENARLKKIVADLSLDREMLQDVIRRKI